MDTAIAALRAGLAQGRVVPYLGPGVLALAGADCPLPATPKALVKHLTAKASVPHKLHGNLTGAAQFIENFKHRKTVATAMREAFSPAVEPTALHAYLASLPALPLLVHAWYDDLPQRALAGRCDWGAVQGVSQAEHSGAWCHAFDAAGNLAPIEAAADWATLLYQPLGSVAPAGNFLVSDSDFVEVLTEIDIQTPIPAEVQRRRAGRQFLFLGCRFDDQLTRTFARQVMKRSSDQHYAVLPETPSRNEARFLEQQNIEVLALPLGRFTAVLAGQATPVRAAAG
ncbi:SIR2 family protein [Immundisolibacter sp.]|uniref:SIR2 family NAD-dependent protein deacylase n=1 Tax=Immundisolibacter sp. TaxID=1934948 RepID=UPI002621E69E|nr:SIR2 family protein [Immundisolibacter sp.]MDD3651351.1 SIR2 family protein [Immundisolibacter sp.]